MRFIKYSLFIMTAFFVVCFLSFAIQSFFARGCVIAGEVLVLPFMLLLLYCGFEIGRIYQGFAIQKGINPSIHKRRGRGA